MTLQLRASLYLCSSFFRTRELWISKNTRVTIIASRSRCTLMGPKLNAAAARRKADTGLGVHVTRLSGSWKRSGGA